MARETVIAFRVSRDTAKAIRRAARRDGRLVSAYVRAAVERALAAVAE